MEHGINIDTMSESAMLVRASLFNIGKSSGIRFDRSVGSGRLFDVVAGVIEDMVFDVCCNPEYYEQPLTVAKCQESAALFVGTSVSFLIRGGIFQYVVRGEGFTVEAIKRRINPKATPKKPDGFRVWQQR